MVSSFQELKKLAETRKNCEIKFNHETYETEINGEAYSNLVLAAKKIREMKRTDEAQKAWDVECLGARESCKKTSDILLFGK